MNYKIDLIKKPELIILLYIYIYIIYIIVLTMFV